MAEEESIYKLIPPEVAPEERQERYHSKHDPSGGLAGSTFRIPVKSGALMGPRAGDTPPRKSSAGSASPATKFTYTDRRKAPVAKRGEAPPKPEPTQRDFVRENKSSIADVRKPVRAEPIDYTKKAEYGQVPSYLDEVKREVEREKEQVRRLVEEEEQSELMKKPQMRQLPEDERQQLLAALKAKWDEVNRGYQSMTHMTQLDTLSKIHRKEEYESTLSQLEKSMEKLSKKVVYVAD